MGCLTSGLEDLARSLRSIGERQCDDFIVLGEFDLARESDEGCLVGRVARGWRTNIVENDEGSVDAGNGAVPESGLHPVARWVPGIAHGEWRGLGVQLLKGGDRGNETSSGSGSESRRAAGQRAGR